MHKIDQAVRLLRDYLNGETTPESNESLRRLLEAYPELLDYVNSLSSEEDLKEVLLSYKLLYDAELPESEDLSLQRILKTIKTDKRQPWFGFNFKAVTVAASIAALFFIIFYTPAERLTKKERTSLQIATTIAPGANRAILETSDGKLIELSALQEGIIIADEISYADGSTLLGESNMPKSNRLTLSTPRGGQYQVELSDGTKVWLNAASKLHYPREFLDNHRTVELEGEAYFEVSSDKERPFIVKTKNETVEVLGTHFNVNAYKDESLSYVTLLEGKVSVSLENERSKILLPGQQSAVKGAVMQVNEISVAESVAWKNGEFMFNKESLGSVMRKLSRWYDIEVEMTGGVKDMRVWGSVSRYDTFDEILQVIKAIDDSIHFEIDGRRVKIMK